MPDVNSITGRGCGKIARTYTVEIEIISRTRAIIRHPQFLDVAVVLDNDGMTLCVAGTSDETDLVSIPEDDESTCLAKVFFEWLKDSKGDEK